MMPLPSRALVVVGLLAAGCSGEVARGPQRLIAGEPARLIVRDHVESEPVARWAFAGADDALGWTATNSATLNLGADGLELRAASDDPQLRTTVDLDASDVQTIEIRMSGPELGLLQLFWSGPGQAFARERSLLLPARRATEAVEAYRFDVGAHALWKGRIVKLRFDPTNLTEGRVQIEEIRAFSSRLDLEPALAEKAWKVEADSELRNALLATPGRVIDWPVELPRSASLYFGHALRRGVEIAADAAATRAEEPRQEISIVREDGSTETLFAGPFAPTGNGWHDEVIDLSDHGSGPVTLRFTASSGSAFTGLPVWSDPRVVAAAPPSSAVNVVFVSIDTLRADRLSLNGYPRRTSPRLDAWAERHGVNFGQAIAQAPWTLPSHVSMLSGLDPTSHGANHNRPLPPDLELVATTLRRAGYLTAAWTGGVYMRPEYGFDRGFDLFRYWSDAAENEAELADHVDRALAWLDERRSEPFFLFFHTYEVHLPYRARQPYYAGYYQPEVENPARQVFTQLSGPSKADGYVSTNHLYWREQPEAEAVPLPEELDPVVMALYDSGVAHADAQIGRLLDRLEELDLVDRTVVVVTSDHGEMLGEHGVAGHLYLYEENLRVPLLMSYPPRLPAGRRVERQVRSIDIVPTLLELTGVAGPDGAPDLDGVSLLPLAEGDVAAVPGEASSYMSSGNVGLALRLDNRLKYIFRNNPWLPPARAESLYDLRSEGAEAADRLTTEDATTVAALRDRAIARLRSRPGLRLRIANQSAVPLSGALHAPSIFPGKVTSLDVPCGCLTWKGGEVGFVVAPGETLELALDDLERETVAVRGRLGQNRAAFAFSFDAANVGEGQRHALDGDEWKNAEAADGDADTTISWWWQGPRAASVDAPPSADPKLEAELRALGYLQ